MRLDVHLINKNLVSQEQVQEAIDYQRTHGGSLETHLFRFGYVGESDLVAALSELSGCPAVSLSGLDISDDVLGLLPAEVVQDNQVIPFDHDPGVVKIACSDPGSIALQEDLAQLIPDRTVELYVALGTTLRLAILKYYRSAMPNRVEIEPDSVDEAILRSPLEVEAIVDGVGTQPESEPKSDRECQLLLLDTAENDVPTLGQVLQYQGYLVTVVPTVEAFIESVARHRPHIRVLQVPGDRSTVNEILGQLSDSHCRIAEQPTFLIIDSPRKQEIGDLLRAGFEDIIGSDNVLDLMMIKLRQTRDRIFREQRQRHDLLSQLGTHGSLDDMNVIDLLQAMGPTAKTARLSVTGRGKQLSIFLNTGQIAYAECDDVFGVEAVYSALGWKKGVWSLEPVAPEDLPEPNVNQPTEAILLEGCRRLDEGIRDTGSVSIDDLMSALDQYS